MKNILIYRSGSLGDTIVSLAAIKIIKNFNPKSKIYYLCIKNYDDSSVSPLEVLRSLKLIDKFIEIDNVKNLIEFIKAYKLLRQMKISKFYYLNEDRPIIKKIRDFIFFKVLLNCKIYGLSIFNNNKFYEGYYLANKVSKTSKSEFLIINKLIRNKFKKNIKFDNSFRHKKYITLSPGGRILAKRWKIENWKILIKKIILKNKNIKILILGTKNDVIQNYLISRLYKNNVIDLTGKTTIKKLIYILNFTKLHICHDDGTMHLATLLNKKIITLFHNIDFKEKWFQGNNKNILQLYKKDGINSIKVENVINNLLKLNW